MQESESAAEESSETGSVVEKEEPKRLGEILSSIGIVKPNRTDVGGIGSIMSI